MNKIGFTTVTFRDLNREEICKIADENDIRFIEWGGDIHLKSADEIAENEVVSLSKKYNLTSLSYGSYYRVGSVDYDEWDKIVNTASAVGAKIIRVWLGSKSSVDVSENEFNQLVAETKRLAEIADKKGITVAFEFHKGTYNDNGKSSVKFFEAVNRDNVKTYWQPMSNGHDEENLKAVLPYLITVHVFEWNEAGKRYSLCHGKRKWQNFISIINNANANVNYIMEFVKHDSPRRFSKDLKTLKKLLNTQQTSL